VEASPKKLKLRFEGSHICRCNVIIKLTLNGISLDELSAPVANSDFEAFKSSLTQPGLQLIDLLGSC
jgi:hypothetical protein